MTFLNEDYITVSDGSQVKVPDIDEEFANKIPAMPEEDFNGLYEAVLSDGVVRDPLVVWTEENKLLDGHHRWKIITENRELLEGRFSIVYKSFPDRWAAIAWICANQLHRHNMTELQRMKLIQEEHDARQKSVGAPIGNKNAQKQFGQIGQIKSDEPELVRNGKPGKENTTRPTIAKEHGISEKAVRTAVEVGRGIDKAESVVPGFKNDVLAGKVSVSKGVLSNMRKMEPDEIKTNIEAAYNGEKPVKPIKPIEPKPKKPNGGFCKEDRELYRMIDEAYKPMLDESAQVAYVYDDMADEIAANGFDFVNYVNRELVRRKDLLESKAAREAVRKAIDDIIKAIEKVRDNL